MSNTPSIVFWLEPTLIEQLPFKVDESIITAAIEHYLTVNYLVDVSTSYNPSSDVDYRQLQVVRNTFTKNNPFKDNTNFSLIAALNRLGNPVSVKLVNGLGVVLK